jgi:hypothetical protein
MAKRAQFVALPMGKKSRIVNYKKHPRSEAAA